MTTEKITMVLPDIGGPDASYDAAVAGFVYYRENLREAIDAGELQLEILWGARAHVVRAGQVSVGIPGSVAHGADGLALSPGNNRTALAAALEQIPEERRAIYSRLGHRASRMASGLADIWDGMSGWRLSVNPEEAYGRFWGEILEGVAEAEEARQEELAALKRRGYIVSTENGVAVVSGPLRTLGDRTREMMLDQHKAILVASGRGGCALMVGRAAAGKTAARLHELKDSVAESKMAVDEALRRVHAILNGAKPEAAARAEKVALPSSRLAERGRAARSSMMAEPGIRQKGEDEPVDSRLAGLAALASGAKKSEKKRKEKRSEAPEVAETPAAQEAPAEDEVGAAPEEVPAAPENRGEEAVEVASAEAVRHDHEPEVAEAPAEEAAFSFKEARKKTKKEAARDESEAAPAGAEA